MTEIDVSKLREDERGWLAALDAGEWDVAVRELLRRLAAQRTAAEQYLAVARAAIEDLRTAGAAQRLVGLDADAARAAEAGDAVLRTRTP